MKMCTKKLREKGTLPKMMGLLSVVAMLTLQPFVSYGRQDASSKTASEQQGDTSTARIKVSGKVTDTKGTPLPGVSIIVKGTTTGTSSNPDGTFTLSVPGSKSVLECSYLGYAKVAVEVGNRTRLDIKLEEQSDVLDDVIVIGYGSIKAKEVTSAVSHVSSKDFLSINSNNPMMLVQGKAASVSVSATDMADPNSSASVQIRGISSRNAGLGPLYVIDGIPNGNMHNINPNDIESIDVLKDGAASAIYGTRGSNGVIIVTTKQGGKDGSVHASYNGYFSFDKIVNKPDLLSASEFRQYRVPDGAKDWGASTDWFDAVTQTAFAHSHAVSLTGGTQKLSYRATVDYKDASGIDLRSGREEYGARISLNHGGAKDLLRFGVTVAPRIVNMDFSDQGAIDMSLRANPTFPLMDPDDPTLYSTFVGKLPTGPNPVETLKLIENGAETKFLDWNANASLNLLTLILPNTDADASWTTQVVLGQTITDNFNYAFEPSTTSTNRYNNIKGAASRIYSKGSSSSFEWTTNARYSAKGHTVTALLGYSYTYDVNSGMSARNRNFSSDAYKYNNLGGGDNEAKLDGGRVGMSSDKQDSKLIGFFGRLTYNWKERYMLTASLRYEGSSRFGANNKWGYFPAVSAGWRISDEPFMANVSWINDLKLRGDFGVTGNQNIPNYKSLALYTTYGHSYYNGQYVPIVGPSTNINPNLRWEKGVNWNVGVDFSFFDHILSGSVNYYNRTQKDLVGDYNAPVPPNITPTIFANVGKMKNSGVEVELNIQAVKTRNWDYSIGLIGETMNNKFVSFSNDVYTGRGYDDAATLGLGDFGVSQPIQRIQEGRRIGSFYMHSYAGIDANGDWLVWDAGNKNRIPISKATEEDKRYVGNGLPKFRFSMSHNLRYRNWDMALQFRGAFGFDVFNAQEYAFTVRKANMGYNVFRDAYDQNLYVEDNLEKPTDYFLHKGDYFKLDVVTLGYTLNLPKSRIISGLRVYATVRNLFTIKAYEGLDPDVFPVNGLTPGALTNTQYYPSTVQMLLGVQINF